MTLLANGNVKNKESSLTCFSMFGQENYDYLYEEPNNKEPNDEELNNEELNNEDPNNKEPNNKEPNDEEPNDDEEDIIDKKQKIVSLIKKIEPSLDNLKELLQALGMTDIKMSFDDEKTVLQVSGLIHTDQGPKKIEKR